MSTAIQWSTDSLRGMFVNLTGNLTSAGALWSGTDVSPSGRWKIKFDTGSMVRKTVRPPHYNYDLDMENISVVETAGPAAAYEMYADAFGIVSWGAHPQPGDVPPYLPYGSGWNIKFVHPNGIQPPKAWRAFYRITLTWADSPADFSTWRYSMDVVVQCPSRFILPAREVSVGATPRLKVKPAKSALPETTPAT